MKQVLQSLKNGAVSIADVPAQGVQPGCLLIRSSVSLISAGTERMLLEFGKGNWLQKARQQPDKVRMVLDKVRTDGLAATLESVRAKLDEPLPLGYCNAGEVIAAGPGVTGFAPGGRVLSNGYHAEIVQAPVNLCAPIPDAVSNDVAPFAILGAIALQGIRLAEPGLGETFVVSGLGLIGLLAVQLLRANGCRVIGLDFDHARLALASRFGAEGVDLGSGEDPVRAVLQLTGGRGADGVLVAAATSSSDPIHQAAEVCRKRGRIVLLGVTGLELNRADFYKKELTFQVSCSYGPGRYDPAYEDGGIDYPLPYVRWTARRNIEAVLHLLACGNLDAESLISHSLDFRDAAAAYKIIETREPSLGILLRFASRDESPAPTARTIETARPQSVERPQVGFVGAGGYASKVLIPAFQEAGARLRTVVSAKGLHAANAARKFGFDQCSSENQAVLGDPGIDVAVIATRHDSHARLTCAALKAGKHVFVEKPLALTLDQLNEVEAAARESGRALMVGFNRRFSPQVVRIRQLLQGARESKSFVMTINAGSVPAGHWTLDPGEGGGRIVGECCHFVDLLRLLCGHSIQTVSGSALSGDTATFTLTFADGSIASLNYFANGHRSLSKERLEVFCAGRVLQLDNFRKLTGYGWPGFRRLNLWRQDKGNRAAVRAFLDSVRTTGLSPIPLDELLEVSRSTIAMAQALRS